MYKAVASRWTAKANILVFPCYLIAFIVAGIWHGNSMNFVVFGLLHGGGVSVGKIWEYLIIQRRGRKGLRAYLASKPIEILAIFLTLNFVSFTMLFFRNDIPTAMTILHNFGYYMTHGR
jgi:D-alanyl-lipoteichoic acid acyltransferase DltB (MBOAT superfamily)